MSGGDFTVGKCRVGNVLEGLSDVLRTSEAREPIRDHSAAGDMKHREEIPGTGVMVQSATCLPQMSGA